MRQRRVEDVREQSENAKRDAPDGVLAKADGGIEQARAAPFPFDMARVVRIPEMREREPEGLGHLIAERERGELFPQIVDEGREDHPAVAAAAEAHQDV